MHQRVLFFAACVLLNHSLSFGLNEKDERFVRFAEQDNVAELQKIRGLDHMAMERALLAATRSCFTSTLEHLLNRGYVYPEHQLGLALHIAVKEGHLTCIRLLAKNNAPLNHVLYDKSPLDLAKQVGNHAVIRLLEQLKSKPIQRPLPDPSPRETKVSDSLPFVGKAIVGICVTGVAALVALYGFVVYKSSNPVPQNRAPAARAANPVAIQSALSILENGKSDECCLCIESLASSSMTMNCGHVIHQKCVRKLFLSAFGELKADAKQIMKSAQFKATDDIVRANGINLNDYMSHLVNTMIQSIRRLQPNLPAYVFREVREKFICPVCRAPWLAQA